MSENREHLDVLVVGAGLSGIGAAYRLQTTLPDRTWAVLESREAIGGTWDLFRYPGVRSDSDMQTLGYPFEPWVEDEAIAGGAQILDYVRRTADKYGITERIRFGHRVVAAAWSTPDARWTVTVEVAGETTELTCTFLHLCSGYYDYDRANEPVFPGREDFTGEVVHPQFWPEDLDVSGRRVVIIGSGATAVTLVPALVAEGADVTMLQRSPSWVVSRPSRDRFAERMHRLLPRSAAGAVVRSKNVVGTTAFYALTRRRPRTARSLLTRGLVAELGQETVETHFQPVYDPWDERLCLVPDGDLFVALRGESARVVTDTIETFTATGIRLTSGTELEADVIVTATGLRVHLAGGILLSVDGQERALGDLTVYRGLMFGGVPNLAICIGYVNASWTLRADLVSRYVCRLLEHLDANGLRWAAPNPPEGMEPMPLLPLRSGYLRRAESQMPQQGDAAPWLMRQNYLLDRREMIGGDLTEGMTFGR